LADLGSFVFNTLVNVLLLEKGFATISWQD